MIALMYVSIFILMTRGEQNLSSKVLSSCSSDSSCIHGICYQNQNVSSCLCERGWTLSQSQPQICTYQQKSKLAAFLLSFFVGGLGADWFYLSVGNGGYIAAGVFKMLTLGGIGIWWLVDWMRILTNSFLDGQAQYIDDQSNNDITSTINSFILSSPTVNESITDDDKTILIESSTEYIFNKLHENETSSSMRLNTLINNQTSTMNNDDTSLSTFFLSSSLNDFQSTTVINNILYRNEQWFNYNQANQQGSYDSSIVWRKSKDESLDSSTYILKSEGECADRMCYIKLKYNGSLSNNNDGCLSFILSIRGQPVGQLWIEEDEEQENLSQKIQLINSSLRVEHSLKSKTKNLSIDARILFRNPNIDLISLSNLNVNWNGACPQYRTMIPFPYINIYESTLENNLIKWTSEDLSQTSFLTTNDRFEISEDYLLIESSTVKFEDKISIQRSYSLVNQWNIGWILTLIILFCFLIILFSFLYGLWSIQEHYRSVWYVNFNSPIQLISRRSIHSSIKSENNIERFSQISNDISYIDYQQEDFDSFTTASSQSISSPFYTYF
ncbi:unnamed protein product [Rotaria sp. Silwood1]|nr:unnamed protein product [Rotaria sp. Silwood1]CAF1305813.1 unnamed protein product [Rotaria sp. Silwood1]CAF3545590.1 unnamed protein product [Rotaria sp. Silwood1]CAF4797029.1 unnamed protein product [Rotaria sp. Silwood1]CAF4935235.1 unnamed protein product [Rotaria sp. Silwood1]